MQAQYPLKVQTIRSKGARPRFYVYLPLPLASAIEITSGESVHWELVSRTELRLVRDQSAVNGSLKPSGSKNEADEKSGE